eukprot:scaffold188_cov429-Prasinococcus_capsulatus_cf.AAC.10
MDNTTYPCNYDSPPLTSLCRLSLLWLNPSRKYPIRGSTACRELSGTRNHEAIQLLDNVVCYLYVLEHYKAVPFIGHVLMRPRQVQVPDWPAIAFKQLLYFDIAAIVRQASHENTMGAIPVV